MINLTTNFQSLDPNTFINIIEEAYGQKLTALCNPYTSYINRVYELETENGERIVAKFYRPGRWTKEAIQEEHDFLLDLEKAEVPVIAPLALKDGATIGEKDGICFSVFPKKGGRIQDDFTDEEWLEIGRLVSRVHNVGSARKTEKRVIWTPTQVTNDQIDFILSGNFIPLSWIDQYEKLTREVIELAKPYFKNTCLIRIHGDFRFANLINRPEESFFMIDFDDMAMGPAVQDIWMLLPGYRHETEREMELFIEGYETFREFPRTELKLVEILRAMRYIHFCCWCAHQIQDTGFSGGFPDWGSDVYWRNEINDLQKQLQLIKEELNIFNQN